MFQGIERFEACLTDDKACIAANDSGPHVAALQLALELIDNYKVDQKELKRISYDRSTSLGVSNYNKSRDINSDNVVGRLTIQSLDNDMVRYEQTMRNVSRRQRYHPVHQPEVLTARTPKSPLQLVSAPADEVDRFEEPVTTFSSALRVAIRRSNAAKTPGSRHLINILDLNEGPVSLREISARFGKNVDVADVATSVYTHLEAIGLQNFPDVICEFYVGEGTVGLFCRETEQPFYDKMQQLSDVTGLTNKDDDPHDPPWFCRDKNNIHGRRDSWRRLVRGVASSLHICIPIPVVRGDPGREGETDIHIDLIQEGAVNVCGLCDWTISKATALHLLSVKHYVWESIKDKGLHYTLKFLERMAKLSYINFLLG